ncbi:MAG TPA: hypothetical protein PKE55_14980 [Kiritimatiellia bacterium]|nr:hypothetical protein [Kiritimatiellia bacterium]
MNRVLQQRLNQVSRNNNFLFTRTEQQQAGSSTRHTGTSSIPPRSVRPAASAPTNPQYR